MSFISIGIDAIGRYTAPMWSLADWLIAGIVIVGLVAVSALLVWILDPPTDSWRRRR